MQSTARILHEVEVTYQIVTSECRAEGCEGTLVYGIKVIYYGDVCEFFEIKDISCNKQDVANLISSLIIEDVEHDQLGYIIEDYLAQLYSA